MKKILLAAILLILLVSSASGDTKKRIVIGFKEDAVINEAVVDEVLSGVDYKIVQINHKLKFAVIETEQDLKTVKSKVKSSLVDYVEYDTIYHAIGTVDYPSDPLFSYQWNLYSINVTSAWDICSGGNITVAVVDTGIDYTHPDLAANYVSGGYDWVNNDDDPMDDNGHGTHCAGIIAAVTDNGEGIAGIAQVKLLAEKVLNRYGTGYSSWIANGIVHAADNGAKVISLSLGSDNPSYTIKRACNYAWKKGVLLVAAAGNDGTRGIDYPAAYLSVIAVGAIDENDKKAYFSNYGKGLELVAPGVNILSTYLNSGYKRLDGTSMAAPHVSGVAALLWSCNPDLTNKDVRIILDKTAQDLGKSGYDCYYGFGKIDAYKALSMAFD